MKRKLIQLSPSTSVVSLPSQWIKKNKIKKGSDLELNEIDNQMVISTQSKKSSKDITVDISIFKGKIMWAALDAPYVAGYDSIKIMTRDQEQTDLMSKVIRYFPGMIISDERKGIVEFKDITGDNVEDVDKMLNRIFNINISMLKDSVDAIIRRDWQVLRHIKKRDYIVNSYISYSLRLMNRFGYSPFSKTGLMNTYIKMIEMLSDKLVELLIEIGDKKIVSLKEDINQLLSIYSSIQKNRTRYSQKRILEIDKSRTALKEKKRKDRILNQFFNDIDSILFAIIELEMQLH